MAKKKAAKKAAKSKAVKKKPVKKASKKPAATATKKSTKVNVYLNFNGNCEEAFNFYKSVFGGRFTHVSKFKDMPPSSDHPMPPSLGEKILHIALPISQETAIMGSDTAEGFAPPFQAGNNFSISVHASSKAVADKLFKALSEGGTVTMPIDNVFWGDYFGMLTDKFGIQWMVNFNPKQ